MGPKDDWETDEQIKLIIMKQSAPKPRKTFRTKIPAIHHEKIFEWYCCGLSVNAIVERLEQECAFFSTRRTVTRLVQFMKDEKQSIVASVVAQKTQQSVIQDFDELTEIFLGVKEVAKSAQKTDITLYLRAVDRLTKLLQIKFSLTLKEEATQDNQLDHDTILEGLLEKLGK